MKNSFFYFIILFLLFGFTPEIHKEKKSNKPLNIILLIGDGMGLSQLSSSYYFNDKVPNFSQFKCIGLINTSSASDKITDSGAGGTAFSCGKRTYNGAIGVGVDSLPLQNITELLSKKSYKTGLVVTCGITHATPASFFAHVISRNKYEKIASQLPNSEIDFFAGGGLKYFTSRKDSINYFQKLIENGFIMDSTSLSLKGPLQADKKYGFMLAKDEMLTMKDGRGNFLAEATTMAINYLSMNDKGFFLMVEGSQIDWGGHNNDAQFLISEVIDFDNAIGAALEFAKNDGNTLVIVTADHETGGFTLAPNHASKMEGDYNTIAPVFATTGHSATLIPIFAFGPHSEDFQGIYENFRVFEKIVNAVGK